MTSTSTSSGYSLQRNSSKVIQPPGGRTADIFGRSIPEQQQQQQQHPNHSSASSQAGSDIGQQEVSANLQPAGLDANSYTVPGADSGNQQHQPQQQLEPQLVQADDFKPVNQGYAQSTQQQSDIPYNERTAAQQAKINVPLRRNPITGEVYQDGAAQPPIRVRQPPGGPSSGIF